MLFQPSEKNPSLEEQLYLFLKRFNTQPSEFFGMERGLRMRIYRRELKLVIREYEENEKLNSK